MKELPNISVIIPVYGCKTALVELYLQLVKVLNSITNGYEIIFVNDASPDGAWETIEDLSKKDNKVKGINFSRNFGQHYAIFAGLENCIGEWVVVMDCDLQDKPDEIISLYNKAKEGYDIVLGRRYQRQDNFIKRLFSKYFYKFLAYLTNTKQDSSVANYGIYHREVINTICKMQDSIKYFPAMVKWVGFNAISIDIEHSNRYDGKTSYSYRKLINLGLDVVLSFSDKPLRLTVKFGILISFLSILFAIYNLIKYLNGEILISGWTSLIMSIWFLSGIIIFIMGLIGLYIGKIFDRVKNRPVYVIREKINL